MFYALSLSNDDTNAVTKMNDLFLDKRSILIVDDDADSREVLAQVLQMQGISRVSGRERTAGSRLD
jgi:PleD family two-component response regulator